MVNSFFSNASTKVRKLAKNSHTLASYIITSKFSGANIK